MKNIQQAVNTLLNFQSDTECICGSALLPNGNCSRKDCITNPEKPSQTELDELKAWFNEERRKSEIAWYRKWTMNGKHLITNAGGNFWMRGGNRSKCSIIKPELLALLVEHGILAKVAGGYRFVIENAERAR